MRLTCLVGSPRPVRSSRGGLTRIEVIVVAVVLLVATAALLPQMQPMREQGGRGTTCRSNMRAVANAVFQYANDNGRYPGYMNVLQRTDGSPFVDPETGEVTPVSWCVMIMPYIDRRPTFDQWQHRWDDVPEEKKPVAFRFFTDQYIDLFLCPSDPQQAKTGTPISFVANTGLPDRPTAVAAVKRDGGEVAANDMVSKFDLLRAGTPRDWGANGIFFDNFSEHQLVKTTGPRGPMEYMSDNQVKDPHAMTIFLTENVDAGNYVFRSATHAADYWKACEVQTGCIWRPGPIDATKKPPTMTPPVESLKINVDKGRGDGKSYDFCRPSSRHPQSVNVAFVGQNVMSLRDSISYFVYAKLMASDDAAAGYGQLDATFGSYKLSEEDLLP